MQNSYMAARRPSGGPYNPSSLNSESKVDLCVHRVWWRLGQLYQDLRERRVTEHPDREEGQRKHQAKRAGASETHRDSGSMREVVHGYRLAFGAVCAFKHRRAARASSRRGTDPVASERNAPHA